MSIARAVLADPRYRVVGAVDIDIDKVGRDVGILARELKAGVNVVHAVEDLPSGVPGGVAVLCTASTLESVLPQVRALLDLGWNVVSTCEELSEPWSWRSTAESIDKLAKLVNCSVLGTGVNPGYVLDTLPLVLSAATLLVRQVTVRRSVDTDERRAPLQRKTGMGLSPGKFHELVAAGRVGHVGLLQSAQLLAAGLGWAIDTWEEHVDPVMASERDQPGNKVPDDGTVIGLRQTGVATWRGRPVIRYEMAMFSKAANIDEIRIDGEPPILSSILGGLNGDLATAAIVTNIIPTVRNARAGLLTMRDIVPLGGLGA